MSSAKLTYSINTAIAITSSIMSDSSPHVMTTVIREATSLQAFEWYAKTFPRHFKGDAKYRYGSAYTPRSPRYNARKRRRNGVAADLVLTGEMRDLFLQGRPTIYTKINRRSAFSQLRFPYVRKANFYRGKGAKNHDFYREMTAFNQQDQDQFNRGVEQKMVAIALGTLNRPGVMQTEVYEAS